eukprot:5865195-Prymnesium_polylepis.1
MHTISNRSEFLPKRSSTYIACHHGSTNTPAAVRSVRRRERHDGAHSVLRRPSPPLVVHGHVPQREIPHVLAESSFPSLPHAMPLPHKCKTLRAPSGEETSLL